MAKYGLGIDFGTLSGRIIAVDLDSGEEVCSEVCEYANAVITEELKGVKLPEDYALQYPDDYIAVLYQIRPMLDKYNINPADIAGIGVDFTACTMFPVSRKYIPLCFYKKYSANPHVYVKLWKHHSAQKYADMINEKAKREKYSFIKRYGGKVSSEWLMPKIMETAELAPEIYDEAAYFVEAADFITYYLTGKSIRNSCCAGFKGFWNKKSGMPKEKFFSDINPALNGVYKKLPKKVCPSGTKIGSIKPSVARSLGLCENTAVAAGIIDAHAAVPASGAVKPGDMLMIMGTSTCHMLLSDKYKALNGICGVVEDGIIPGLYGYEAGQACVGDSFEWAVKNILPERYFKAAAEKNLNIHSYMEEYIKKLKPGESGIVALDWWNGNRTPLTDASLSGVIAGLTLNTKPEEIYLAMIEATAFGSKIIIDNFTDNGLPVKRLFAAGGISYKNDTVMQIYADILDREIFIADTVQAGALGCAIYAGAAAGYFDLEEGVRRLSKVKAKSFKPDASKRAVYDRLYGNYKKLFYAFGEKDLKSVMYDLKQMKNS